MKQLFQNLTRSTPGVRRTLTVGAVLAAVGAAGIATAQRIPTRTFTEEDVRTSYYFVFVAALAPLATRRQALGVVLLLLCGGSQLLAISGLRMRRSTWPRVRGC